MNRRAAAKLGFTQSEVGQAIANALRGTKVGTVVLQGESRDIMIRPQNAEDATPAQIAALELPVSQLQQQQATERATDKLEAKQDALTEEGDELTEDGEDLADQQAALGDRQQAVAEEQQDKALEAAADQRADLREADDARDEPGRRSPAQRGAAARPRPHPPHRPRRPRSRRTSEVGYLQQRGLAAWQHAGRFQLSWSRPGRSPGRPARRAARRSAGAGRGER